MCTENGAEAYYFHEGTAKEAYRYLGAHVKVLADGFFYTFRTFAPRAASVHLIGDFCGWDAGMPMERVTEGGVFEIAFRDSRDLRGSLYKFLIRAGGREVAKGDPYAFASRGGSDGASVLCGIPSYNFGDKEWMAARRAANPSGGKTYLPVPLNIYEVHLGSFLRSDGGAYLGYAELADRLLGYVKYMGYTHVELLPIAEFPFDGSWGYQVCAGYAPTSRFGAPLDFCRFVDRLHEGGVGVILDWVPAHFPKDEWGLYQFDGAPLYEYEEEWRREAPSWGTVYFDLGRREVRSYLISNALFWLREYHIDGLRVDAVASMLYLDYDRAPGKWRPNAEGNNRNTEAEEFFRQLNTAVHGEFPDALMIAEESTAWPRLTHPVLDGGLGFSLKWNMGYSNDLFEYLSTDPIERRRKHKALNFPITYAFSEKYVLPISHDEVVHGKGSFLLKMHGDYEEKFATFRAAMLFFMTFPGKKLLFMGTEYGQWREWDFSSSLEWQLLDVGKHDALREYVAALNRFYLASPPLYENDFCPEGFSWVLADEADRDVVAYLRRDLSGEELLVVISFSGTENRGVRLPLSSPGEYRAVFETSELGGGARYTAVGCEGGAELLIDLAPLSGVVLRRSTDTVIL